MPKTKTSITIEEDLRGKLDVIARAEKRSMSNLIEMICYQYIGRRNKK